MLYFNKRVDLDSAKDERFTSHSKYVSGDNFGGFSKVFWSTWQYQKSQTGTCGCPTEASVEKGEVIFE